MSNRRSLVFSNDNYYHIYNRGIDRRKTYTCALEYKRMLSLLAFYQYELIPIRYSRFNEVNEHIRQNYFEQMQKSGKIVEVVAYCLMPNHFHLLLKQRKDNGIATYIANSINAYTKYFNKKNKRNGNLFQGVFKASYIESDELLSHLIRYIHLNPVASKIVEKDRIEEYLWSSHNDYMHVNQKTNIIEHKTLVSMRALITNYKEFIYDQVSYSLKLKEIMHLTHEHEEVQTRITRRVALI